MDSHVYRRNQQLDLFGGGDKRNSVIADILEAENVADKYMLSKESIFDKNNDLWYELQGDYYIPCLKLPEINIGIWGERYLTYIREHKKLLHTKLVVNGTLYTHLAEINQQAEEMFSELVNQMKVREGITEQLKADNQMAWVGRMNNIRNRVTETVNIELIYS